MLTRTALLYLSRQHSFKNFFSYLPGFKQVTRRFIAGENIDDAILAIKELNTLGISATFDHLGESTTSAAEAEADVREYFKVLRRIDETGVNSNVSVKPTQLGLDISEDLCHNNIRRIVEEARRYGNFVRMDMEGSDKTDATLRIFYALRAEFDNVGIVLQAYLYRTEKDLEKVMAMKLMKKLLKSGVYHGMATHHERMIQESNDFAKREGIGKDQYEFQMLYGIRRDLQLKLAQEGYRVRTYVPYGEYWYPYFMRRLAERPANVWFILKNALKG
jgi:proline dehydrogenase